MRTRVGDAAEHEHTPSSAATARLCALRTTLLWQLHPHRRQILLPRSSTHDDIRAANYLHPNENDPRNHPAAHEHERPCRDVPTRLKGQHRQRFGHSAIVQCWAWRHNIRPERKVSTTAQTIDSLMSVSLYLPSSAPPVVARTAFPSAQCSRVDDQHPSTGYLRASFHERYIQRVEDDIRSAARVRQKFGTSDLF
ncbi:hypothetical protein BST61_g6922 [Cercospora zeina]